MNGNVDRWVGPRHGVLDSDDPASPRRGSLVSGVPAGELITLAPEPAPRCVVTTSDRAGRLADRSVVRCLGWARHTSVRFDWRCDVILVVPATGGTSSITTQGHLRLPLSVRRRSRLDPGSRLLVLAWPQAGRLVICTPSAVEEMLLDRMRGASGTRAGTS